MDDRYATTAGQVKAASPFEVIGFTANEVECVADRVETLVHALIGSPLEQPTPRSQATYGSGGAPGTSIPALGRLELANARISEDVRRIHRALERVEAVLA